MVDPRPGLEEADIQLTTRELALWRLANQRITGSKPVDPGAVVRWLGAMQAQDYQQAVWAVGLRTEAATVTDIEQAIADRTIVRTWPMRGTIHFVPAADAKWMLRLCASRVIARDGRRLEQLGLDASIIERSRELVADTLRGGKRLSRAGMLAVLEVAGISTAGQRGYHLLWYLAQTGLICFGPQQGTEQTFVLLDEWVPDSHELDGEEALAVLAGRYFASHGPATVHDFARWAGLTVTEARAGLAAAPGLTRAEVDGTAYWMAADAPSRIAEGEGRAFLLPGFDEYLLGYKDRRAVLADEHAPRIVPGNNGVFQPMIVVAGQVVGTWKRAIKKRGVELTLTPFAPLGEAEASVSAAATGYSAFLGLPLAVVTIGA